MLSPIEPALPKNLQDRIKNNLDKLRSHIANAAQRSNRSPDDIHIIAVTKTVGIEEIRILAHLGLSHFGENRLQAARDKIPDANRQIQKPPNWHMIGNIQRRKVKEVVRLFDAVDAIDRISLAQALHRACEQADTTLDALLEINISGEEAKHGFSPEALPKALDDLANLDRLNIKGLMTMAPHHANETTLHTIFRQLNELAKQHKLPEISMGMSDDFQIAIEEGATEIRIGRALYQ